MGTGAKPSGIAVIITVYNKEAFLRDAIESVQTQRLGTSITISTSAQQTSLQQTFSIILCDDGSTDKSRDICAEYAARYSSVYDITDGVHRGVVGNFLHCLEFALSLNVQYISQLDSDDILADPDFLARQTSFLDSHPEAQAACSKFFLIGEKDTLKDARKMFPGSILTGADGVAYYRDLKITPKVLLTKNNTLVAGGVTYRAAHLREYLDTFASKEDATQDLPLWLFLSQKGSFWGTDIQSLAYRNLAESVSRSEDIETQLKFQQASLSTRLRFIKCMGLERHETKARRLYQKKMLRHYAKLSPKNYPKQFKQALKANPSLLFSRDLWRSLGVYLKNR
ncbi:MAG: glycosyltransferase family 2 protein [Bacteroidales bacterium]|nr:glycosyltransferase family 2 protein [Bacteroidales bacterium]